MSDGLLARVHDLLGLGLDITTFPNGHVEVCWRRDHGYDGWSDERFTSASSLTLALHIATAHEAWADAQGIEEAA